MNYRLNPKKENGIYFSRKEKIMLNMLLRNGRTFNTTIARRLKISSQVTGRIRKRLEKDKVIREYSIDLDHKFLGIHSFALVLFDIEDGDVERLMAPNLINLYKVVAGSITHIALYAFKNLEESDNFFNFLMEQCENIKIKKSFIFPSEGILKHSSRGLFYNAIREFDNKGLFQRFKFSNELNDKRKRSKELTLSEKAVLKSLIKNTTISCKKISSNLKMNITRTGVNRIKNRLENKKIIEGYDTILDYKKLGINCLAFIFSTPSPEILKQQEAYIKKAQKVPTIIGCYRLSSESALFCGFKNLNELENYCDYLRKEYYGLIKINHIHIISSRGVIKESFSDLHLSLLN